MILDNRVAILAVMLVNHPRCPDEEQDLFSISVCTKDNLRSRNKFGMTILEVRDDIKEEVFRLIC